MPPPVTVVVEGAAGGKTIYVPVRGRVLTLPESVGTNQDGILFSPCIGADWLTPSVPQVPIWGQTGPIPSDLPPKRDWGPKRVIRKTNIFSACPNKAYHKIENRTDNKQGAVIALWPKHVPLRFLNSEKMNDLGTVLTLLGPQSRFGDKLLGI